jgi:uncharacterized membrane protein YsdA (DUF1294 family)/cold shock CspA family protein
MRKFGKIVSWKSDKGFGFIAPSNGGSQLFVHIKALDRSLLPPKIGVEVSYVASADPQGRPRAENVEPIRKKAALGSASKALLVAGLFLLIVAAICALGILPMAFLWLYLGTSVVSFVIYARDKSAAEAGKRRTPEDTLHTLALIGGWPGALYAQQLLRHKSSKASFRAVFWTTVVLNVSAMVYLVSDYGTWLVEIIEKLVG